MKLSWNSKFTVIVLSVFAIVLFILGIFDMNHYLSKQRYRNNIRANGQHTTGFAVDRHEIRYNTPTGYITSQPLVPLATGTLQKYSVIEIIYDKSNPKNFIIDQSDTAYNITMLIVALKLFAVSLIVGTIALRISLKLKTEQISS